MVEHIVAIFGTENAAAAAESDLENAGVSKSAIRRYNPRTQDASRDTSVSTTAEPTSSGGVGFWAWLLGEEPSAETTRTRYPQDEGIYERRARAGEAILSVTVSDDSQIHHVITILESHHATEIDESTQETGGLHCRRAHKGGGIGRRPRCRHAGCWLSIRPGGSHPAR